MIKTILSLSFIIFSLINFGFKEDADHISKNTQDKSKEILERQILYNGRIWQNQFFNTEGNQFLLSSDFSTSGVDVAGHNFDSVKIRYDLINDELQIQRNDGTIIMLNKEMVNSFSLFYYSGL